MHMLVMILVAYTAEYDEFALRLCWETGDAYYQQNLLDQAETEFREALEIFPDCPEAWLGLGRIYSRRESWVAAERYLRSYLELRPGSGDGLLALAEVMLAESKPAEAADLALQAAEMASGEPGAWLLAARASLVDGDTLEAVRSWSMASQAGGTPAMEALTWIARVALARGDEEEAKQLLEPCADAGYAPACYHLAKLYFSWGDFLRASEQASTSLYLEPAGEFSDSARLMLDSISSSGSLVPLPEP
jgi:uncharacterized protein HemY